MNLSEELIALIGKYEAYISKGNMLLKKYFNVNKPPFLAKRDGVIPVSGTLNFNNEQMAFRFHGIGCRFEFKEAVIEFDYTFGDFIYKGFQVSKLFWFIESYFGASEEIKKEDIFKQVISELELKGKIKKKDGPSYDTYDYIFVG